MELNSHNTEIETVVSNIITDINKNSSKSETKIVLDNIIKD